MQNNLETRLTHIKNQHRKTIDLSLERVKSVAERLNLLRPSHDVLTVGGTNGKGSTVAGLEAVYCTAGFRVGAFTSPYLYRFNELIRVNGQEASDEDIIQAFEQIEKARGELTLTQFEFNTLAALWIFAKAEVDVMILEVGLGGRLDAVNIIDADVSIVTTIAIDHTELLGDTREKIGFEKAGIFRTGRPAICGDFSPPQSILSHAKELNTPLYCQGKEYGYLENPSDWTWYSNQQRFEKLPLTTLALQNIAAVLMAVELMQSRLPVERAAIDKAFANLHLAGRIEVLPGDVTQIIDVAHNPASAARLAEYLQKHKPTGKVRAVFSMLSDKDIVDTLEVIKAQIDEWHVAALQSERAASLEKLKESFAKAQIKNVYHHDTIQLAHQSAMLASSTNDLVVIFGSFYTVAEWALHKSNSRPVSCQLKACWHDIGVRRVGWIRRSLP